MLYTRGWNSTFLRHKITGIQNLVFSKKAWIHLYSICDLFISDLHSTHQTTNLTSRICYFKSIISCVRNSHPILCFETIVGLDKKLVFWLLLYKFLAEFHTFIDIIRQKTYFLVTVLQSKSVIWTSLKFPWYTVVKEYFLTKNRRNSLKKWSENMFSWKKRIRKHVFLEKQVFTVWIFWDPRTAS